MVHTKKYLMHHYCVIVHIFIFHCFRRKNYADLRKVLKKRAKRAKKTYVFSDESVLQPNSKLIKYFSNVILSPFSPLPPI